MRSNLVLCFRAPDRAGIVAAITGLLALHGADIRGAEVHGDDLTGGFFCRMTMTAPLDCENLACLLRPVAEDLQLDWQLHDLARNMRVLIAVSRFGHCLIDLVHKQQAGQLPIEIVGVVSNHDVLRETTEWHGLPFHHIPTSVGKEQHEASFRAIVEQSNAELVVLARYMQILSHDFSSRLAGRCINIHHSFLPSFKGAKPYHQAHARGVKLIGATAHFVTVDLDEGPIIEQGVHRVTHAVTAEQMVEIGREIEASVLSRAVRYYAERRVFLNGGKTVVLQGT